jgi:hypothetical protein
MDLGSLRGFLEGLSFRLGAAGGLLAMGRECALYAAIVVVQVYGLTLPRCVRPVKGGGWP